jgi:multiple sugar transport system permease protein
MMLRRRLGWVALCLAILVVLAAWLFPLYWIVATSLKTRLQAFAFPPIWTFTPTLESYNDAFVVSRTPMTNFLVNSVIVAVATTVVSMLLGTTAAYALARFPIKGKKNLIFWILSTRMAPPIAVVLPLFLIMQQLKLINTFPGVILAYTTFNLPFVVWMMRGFFGEISRELEEAALIDGATPWRSFWWVGIPLAAPGLVATAIFCFIFSWNEFLFALVLTGVQTQTLPVAITAFWSTSDLKWGQFMATGVVTIAPVLVFAIAVQRYLVRGITLGAIKG